MYNYKNISHSLCPRSRIIKATKGGSASLMVFSPGCTYSHLGVVSENTHVWAGAWASIFSLNSSSDSKVQSSLKRMLHTSGNLKWSLSWSLSQCLLVQWAEEACKQILTLECAKGCNASLDWQLLRLNREGKLSLFGQVVQEQLYRGHSMSSILRHNSEFTRQSQRRLLAQRVTASPKMQSPERES